MLILRNGGDIEMQTITLKHATEFVTDQIQIDVYHPESTWTMESNEKKVKNL